ncbi:MAG: inositol monophosphatase family protein [Pirellulales bacterium]
MSQLVNVCEEAARAGGKAIQQFRGPLGVREKGPSDLVTEADLASQRAIRRIVETAFPTHGFVGEEEGATQRPDAEYCWVADPLDGTANFVHGLPQYSVSVAVERDGVVQAGAVYDPVAEECYTAIRGGGAYLNGIQLRTSRVEQIGQAMLAISLPPKVKPESVDMRDLVEITQHCQAIRRMGSAALNLCYLAAGRIDGYWAAVIYPWDVAAGVLAVCESGGVVTARDGGPFDLWRPAFLAAATESLHAQIASHLTGC